MVPSPEVLSRGKEVPQATHLPSDAKQLATAACPLQLVRTTRVQTAASPQLRPANIWGQNLAPGTSHPVFCPTPRGPHKSAWLRCLRLRVPPEALNLPWPLVSISISISIPIPHPSSATSYPVSVRFSLPSPPTSALLTTPMQLGSREPRYYINNPPLVMLFPPFPQIADLIR